MGLRIQSGAARGRPLKSLEGPRVRPILGRMRKSIFDILRPRLVQAQFLDLFAGNGTVGLEALSNGAARAVFVDAHPASCRIIDENLTALGFKERGEVHRMDAVKDLGRLGRRVFDVIYMGPPYKDAAKNPLALTVPALTKIHESGLAGPDTVVIGQHHIKEPMRDLSPAWEIFRETKYGDTMVTFFRLKRSA